MTNTKQETWREEYRNVFSKNIRIWSLDEIEGYIERLLSEERNLQEKLREVAINNLITDVNTARKEERLKVLEEVQKEVEKDLQHDTYCKIKGEQYKECALCYVERKLSTLINQLKTK